jgi:tetratricopeptide (TPR) repeat protein
MLKEATQLGLARQFDQSIALLEKLRQMRPDDTALKVYLGGMYASARRMREAESILAPVLAADPRQFDATMHLASGYLFAGDLDRAATYAARALELRPASADASKLQGIVLWRRGGDREATAAFEAAAAADPRDAMPHLWMGMILGQQGRYVDARRRFEAAISKNPLLGDALLGVADTYAAMGSFEQARLFLERAEQAEPDNPRLPAARQRIDAATRSNR